MSASNLQENKSGYHHGELPETLMRLALQHIEASGTEKLSLRALAREAGVSATAPYRHFPTKRCLLAAIATQGFEQLRKRTAAAVHTERTLEDRFIDMGLAYVDFALENPIAYQLMFGSILSDFSEYEQLNRAAMNSYAQVQEMLQELIDARQLPYDVDQLGGVIWAGVHGIASLLLNKLDLGEVATLSKPQASLLILHEDPEQALRIMFGNLLA